MTRKEVFFFGAIGGVMPILVTIISVDLSPIIDNPDEERRMRGRTYQLFYDGRNLRLVAWRTPRAVYWVSNTLSESLTNKQMLSIAASTKHL